MRELRELVDELTLPHTTRVRQELDRTRTQTRTVTHAALITQLETALHTTVTGGNGVASDASGRIPIDSNAWYWFQRMNETVADWCARAGVDHRDTLAGQLRAWYARTLAWTNWDDTPYVDALTEWVSLIRSLVNPRKVLELPDNCPRCGASQWENDSGDKGLHPLILSYAKDHPRGVLESAMVRCRACGEDWRGLTRVREIAFDLFVIQNAIVEES